MEKRNVVECSRTPGIKTATDQHPDDDAIDNCKAAFHKKSADPGLTPAPKYKKLRK